MSVAGLEIRPRKVLFPLCYLKGVQRNLYSSLPQPPDQGPLLFVFPSTDFHEETLKGKVLFGFSRKHLRRRQWHPTPVLLPRESHGWRSLVGRRQSMGSLRVWHDGATSLSLFTFMHWRRTWQPTPVFLPGESQGRGSLVGCRLWGHTESDTTEAT